MLRHDDDIPYNLVCAIFTYRDFLACDDTVLSQTLTYSRFQRQTIQYIFSTPVGVVPAPWKMC